MMKDVLFGGFPRIVHISRICPSLTSGTTSENHQLLEIMNNQRIVATVSVACS